MFAECPPEERDLVSFPHRKRGIRKEKMLDAAASWKRNSGKRDRDSYVNQSETWPEEVREVNVKNANRKLGFTLTTSKLSAKDQEF